MTEMKRCAEVVDNVVTRILMYEVGRQPKHLVEATDGAEVGGTYDGSTFTPKPLYASQSERDEALKGKVNNHRDLLIQEGLTVSLTGYGEVPVMGRPEDRVNILALSDTAQDMADANKTSAKIPFRGADNTMHQLTPSQVQELTRKVKEYAQAVYSASWDLKDNPPIPDDYADPKYWPAK